MNELEVRVVDYADDYKLANYLNIPAVGVSPADPGLKSSACTCVQMRFNFSLAADAVKKEFNRR